jgi:hypothetical protein
MSTAAAKRIILKENNTFALDVFRERCEARAILVGIGALDLHTSVDALQDAAGASGLVIELGQDAVQVIMAAAFANMPRAGQLEDAIAELAEGLEKPMPRPRAVVARSTINAAKYLIKQNDPARFKTWLARHSRAERNAIKQHLKAKR